MHEDNQEKMKCATSKDELLGTLVEFQEMKKKSIEQKVQNKKRAIYV